MESKNKNFNTNTSMINYHLVFCPHYRRKIFSIDGVESRFQELLRQICKEKNYDIISIECGSDYCHLFVNVPPTDSAHEVMKNIKSATSTPLRSEFQELSLMKVLWTRTFLSSTAEHLSHETINHFVESQKKR